MTENTTNEAAWALVKSFQETNQAVVNSIVAATEHNTKFAQRFFSEGMEILKANQAAAEDIIAAQQRTTHFMQNFFSEEMDVLKTNQAIASNIASVQKRNTEFVQRFFTEGVDTLKNQAERARALVGDLQEKVQAQQEAFQRLTQESMQTYLNAFRDPFSSYQQTVEAAQAASQQGLESLQKATQQTVDTAQAASRQGMENIQKTTQQTADTAHKATQHPVVAHKAAKPSHH